MLTVRRATQNDLLDIFKLCVAMHQETDFGNFPLNPEKMIAQLSHWKDHNLLLVAEDDGKIVGMMAGSKRDQWYSDEFLAAEDFIFVDKDHRGTRAAFLLMREFMQRQRLGLRPEHERHRGSDGDQHASTPDRKSTRLNSSHTDISRMPSSA